MQAVEMPNTQLTKAHYDHMISEGFTPEMIAKMERSGLQSITKEQALKQGFKSWHPTRQVWLSSSGLKMPFTSDFAQIRCDDPLEAIPGKPRKYLTPYKKQSQAFIPKGCKVITEGYKDAMAGCAHGKIATGAVAGVSHIQKAIPKKQIKDLFPWGPPVILFDSDGWQNPQVMAALIKGALHLGSKIQLVPPLENEPKGGLCEYFKAGNTASDYEALISAAMTPEEILEAWQEHWPEMNLKRRGRAVRIATTFTFLMGEAA
jgi:hypothetical protein